MYTLASDTYLEYWMLL